MKYVGSKLRIKKFLLPFILKGLERTDYYIEPFVGGANMIDSIPPSIKRIGADSNKFVIALFQALQQGWEPPDKLSFEEYTTIRFHQEDFPPELVGFASICCSFGAKEWGGYARGKTSYGVDRNYCLEQKKNLLKQLPFIQNVTFKHSKYEDLEIPSNSLIYCDPPYRNTQEYRKNTLNYEEYYDWLRNQVKLGHKIFCSEYKMPEDFTSIYSRYQISSLDKDTGSKVAVEKLFIL